MDIEWTQKEKEITFSGLWSCRVFHCESGSYSYCLRECILLLRKRELVQSEFIARHQSHADVMGLPSSPGRCSASRCDSTSHILLCTVPWVQSPLPHSQTTLVQEDIVSHLNHSQQPPPWDPCLSLGSEGLFLPSDSFQEWNGLS